MIRCKLVETTDASQTATRVGRAVSGETLALGRAASCRIYLPDPAVRLEHATISRAEDGGLYLVATGPVYVNNKLATSVRLAAGQQLSLGPFDFVVESIQDGVQTIHPSLTLAFSRRDASVQAAQSLHLQAFGSGVTRWGRRRIAWALSLSLLLVCAVIPYWHAQQKESAPAVATASPSHRTSLDVFWNPGELSSAHQNFADNCKACHARPFERVTDSTCTVCHERIGPHATDPKVNEQAFQAQRCASCHKEHQGAGGMRTVDTLGCEKCHADLQAIAPDARLRDVSDFGKDHPPFRLNIAIGQTQNRRIEQTTGLRVDSGLKFSHQVHLDRAGIKSPLAGNGTGGRLVLQCRNCHEKDASGARFEPVRMDKHCQECHRLSVDAQAPQRQVPHTDFHVVAVATREIYAGLAVERFPSNLVVANRLLQRPSRSDTAPESVQSNRWVSEQSELALAAMFSAPNGVCTTCHAVTAKQSKSANNVLWEVTPILATRHWLPGSRFTHAQHEIANCEECHRARTSKEAADVLIPAIDVCRTCHSGSRAVDGKITSRCDSCHGFHAKLVKK